MDICLYVYMCICIYVYMCIYVYIYKYVYVYVHMYMYIYIYIHIHMYICICMCTCIHAYQSIYVRTCIHIFICKDAEIRQYPLAVVGKGIVEPSSSPAGPLHGAAPRHLGGPATRSMETSFRESSFQKPSVLSA